MYEVILDNRALQDVQNIIEYYETKSLDLGRLFSDELDSSLLLLSKSPFFQIRYSEIHCLPLKKFPYMIHYRVDENKKLILVSAVFSTHINPENWEKRQK